MLIRRFLCLAFSVFLFMALSVPSHAGDAFDKGACFDNIDAQVPDDIVAGKEFEVIITFPECSGMTLNEGLDFPWTLGLVISLPGSVIPPVLNNANFSPSFPLLVSIHKIGPLKMLLMGTEGHVFKKWALKMIPEPYAAHAMDGIPSDQNRETYSALSECGTGENVTGRTAEHRVEPGFGILRGINIRESCKTGVVSFSTNGISDYEVFCSAEPSTKWITIIIPKVIPDLPRQLPGGEKILGKVKLVKRKNGGGVGISVEILPVEVKYKVI